VSLPANLVEQRPDVGAAEAQVHSASAEIGVAIANMVPSVTLSANGGYAANMFSRFFEPGTSFWSIAASVTQPIFEGGTLLHKTRAARAAFEETAATYRSTVIAACQNVADALRALQSDAKTLAAAVAAERAAAATLNITRRQLELGQVAYLLFINAENTYEQAIISLVQARAARLADTAGLFQALGGGWWNRKDVVAAANQGKGSRPWRKPASD
jgi:NodT family efflux transporter outer membrane factor (OMF) lipoprotein